MSKQKAGIAWGKATKELKDKIKFVLQQAQNNRYSVSRIYAAYNTVFELQEAPQTCATCLTSRVAALRKWWGENTPKDSVATTGEAQEATSYEGVVSKYKLPIGDQLGQTEDEGSILQPIVTAGQEASGMGLNEFALLEQRYGELVGAAANTELLTTVDRKLGELGITSESSDADTLAGYEVLAASEGISENEQAFYNAQIEILKRSAVEGGDAIAFTPETEGAQFGIATKGGQLLPAGNYHHEGQQYAVNGDEGRYTVITGEPAGDEAKTAAEAASTEDTAAGSGVRSIDMGEGLLGMDFTPSAENATKGTILNADGSKVKIGTYTAADGTIIAVSAGGKASIKSAE